MNAEQLRDEWILRNNNVPSSTYIDQIKPVKAEGTEFFVILYRDNKAGDNTKPIGSIGSLNIFSRRRIRVPYHVTLRSIDEPHIQPGKQFSEWHWCISPQNLEDAIEFACATHFVVTLSTVKSGASEPLNVHFQAVPKVIEWNDTGYELFSSLLRSRSKSQDFGRQKRSALQVSVLEYPASVVEITGQKRDVCEKALALCLGYDFLRTFNLIIVGLGEEQGGREVALYWFPRRFDGQVVPRKYEQYRWAFGSFEMAGVFPTGNADIYNDLCFMDLSDALREVSIQEQSSEECILANLLRYP